MCSYNAVNGIPSCANSFIQNDIVRNQWGFSGFIVSSASHFHFTSQFLTCPAVFNEWVLIACIVSVKALIYLHSLHNLSVSQSLLYTSVGGKQPLTSRHPLHLGDLGLRTSKMDSPSIYTRPFPSSTVSSACMAE